MIHEKYLKKISKKIKSALNFIDTEFEQEKIQKKEPKFYKTKFDLDKPTNHSLQVAKNIRKSERKPAIIIHGVMQRSGTVYLGNLLKSHPDIYAFPNDIWEIPFLRFVDNLTEFENQFFKTYPKNKGKIGKNDFLPLFGSAFIDYLYSLVPEGKQLLLKVPNVRYLNYFYLVFPHETLLLLIRDGRDVVSSTIKTWPNRKFLDVCWEWNNSAQMILGFDAYYRDRRSDYLLAKYEDVLDNPVDFIKKACDCYELDTNKFPFEKLDKLPVVGSSSLQPAGEVTWGQIEKPRNFKPTQHWLSWSEEEKQLFKEIAGQTLIDLGYEKDLNWLNLG